MKKGYFGLEGLVLTILLCLFCSLSTEAQRADFSKMSSWVKEIAQKNKPYTPNNQSLSTKNQRKNAVPHLCALIKMTEGQTDLLAQYECKEIDRIGNIIIADIPIDMIGMLSANKNILRIEAKRSNTVSMDTSILVIGAQHIFNGRNLPQAFTGKGVVVGVQDVGFDLTHPTFYSRDLKEYRIKAFWDQLSTDTIGSNFYVGQDYVGREEILQYAHSRDAHLLSHGTHTAGSAAGSGYNTDFRGIAPESDICLVSNAVTNDLELIDSLDLYKYTYATDLLGFKYICDYADQVGKPCVVSFSEGSHQDLNGDDILFYEALDQLSTPGHIIVASAGNQGHQYSTVMKPAGKQKAGSYMSSTGTSAYAMVEADDDIVIRIIMHRDAVERDTFEFCSRDVFLAEDSIMSDSLSNWRGDFQIAIKGYRSAYDAETMVFDIAYIAPEPLGLYVPAWIETEGLAANTRINMVHGEFFNHRREVPYGEAIKGYTIHSPSSAPAVICVGATVHRKGYTTVTGNYRETFDQANGNRAFYSSTGPTLDERIKPDVMAPGTNVISSYSSYYIEANPEAGDVSDDISHFGFNGRTYAWNANTGTSMATPIVAGTIALWLEAKPTLTREDIIDIFSKTCSQPVSDIDYPNNEYGYGMINAYAGLLYILGLDISLGSDKLSRNQPKSASFTLENNQLIINSTHPKWHGTIRIYATDGKMILTGKVSESKHSLDLSALKSGIYAVQLTPNSSDLTGSTLIRIS